jgi:hypothetical protein
MKGDIAVAGLMITAEEWQALDAASRAEVVAAITHREDPNASAVVAPVLLAEGTSPGIEVPEAIEELPSSAVSLIVEDTRGAELAADPS